MLFLREFDPDPDKATKKYGRFEEEAKVNKKTFYIMRKVERNLKKANV